MAELTPEEAAALAAGLKKAKEDEEKVQADLDAEMRNRGQ